MVDDTDTKTIIVESEITQEDNQVLRSYTNVPSTPPSTLTQSFPQNRRTENRVELVGRRVTMMGSVWPGEDPDEKFYGVVTKRLRYKGRKGEMVDGYEVLWDDGEKERWPYDYLVVALVPKVDQLIHNTDSDSDDIDDSDDDSDSDGSEEEVDVLTMMAEREDPETCEYMEMFSTSNTGDDIVIPSDC